MQTRPHEVCRLLLVSKHYPWAKDFKTFIVLCFLSLDILDIFHQGAGITKIKNIKDETKELSKEEGILWFGSWRRNQEI